MVSVGDKLLFPNEADFFESQSFYADLRRRNTHRTTPGPVNCVVVATARNCASTSNVFCRDIDNNERGEGKPFQLRKSGNRSFWKNEEITNEGLKFGCQLTYYQSLLRRGCKLGEQDEKQFIFEKKTDKEQVSFHYYTNSTVVSRFFEKLTLPQCCSRFRNTPPPTLIRAPLQNFLFFNFLSTGSLFSFLVFWFLFVKTSPYFMSVVVNKLNFIAYSTQIGQSQDKQQLPLWKLLKYDILLFC